MKFTSPYRHYVLVVRPEFKEIINGQLQRRVGLKAEFNNGQFDSEKAQQNMRWTDKERKEVEKTILEHNEFGKRIFPEKVLTTEEARHYGNVGNVAGARCIASFETPEGSEPCARPVSGDSDYCSLHQPGKAEKSEKAEKKVAV